MAGLGRIQQRFNAAVITVLALAGLKSLGRSSAKDAAAKGYGHPIHRMFFRGDPREDRSRYNHTNVQWGTRAAHRRRSNG